MTQPDTISINIQREAELDADSADLHLQVEGSSVMSGQQAFKQAKEVRALVHALTQIGVTESQIKLRSVNFDMQAGIMLKSSTARYSITLAKVALEQLPAALGAIASQKNCQMQHIAWNYSQAEATRKRLRTEALQAALDQAKADAALLGIRVLGVHTLHESGHAPAPQQRMMMAAASPRSKQRSVDLGFTLGNTMTIRSGIDATFRVSAIAEA